VHLRPERCDESFLQRWAVRKAGHREYIRWGGMNENAERIGGPTGKYRAQVRRIGSTRPERARKLSTKWIIGLVATRDDDHHAGVEFTNGAKWLSRSGEYEVLEPPSDSDGDTAYKIPRFRVFLLTLRALQGAER
jgi:hypothetical protein